MLDWDVILTMLVQYSKWEWNNAVYSVFIAVKGKVNLAFLIWKRVFKFKNIFVQIEADPINSLKLVEELDPEEIVPEPQYWLSVNKTLQFHL